MSQGGACHICLLVHAGLCGNGQCHTSNHPRLRGLPAGTLPGQIPGARQARTCPKGQGLLAPVSLKLDETWGLDHGTWAVLTHVLPNADIPIVQLSIDERQPLSFHYEIGKRLASLREEGILLIGSGNIVHNLHTYAWGEREVQPFDRAVRFEKKVRELLLAGEDGPLIEYGKLGHDAMLSVPTPDHYLPLLYVIALRRKGETISFLVEGFDGGSVSMLTVLIG